MRRPAPHALAATIAAGIVIRVILAVTTSGLPYDVNSFELVRAALASRPLHLYSTVNPAGNFHWPYPPGFLPFVLGAVGLADVFGSGFSHFVRAPAILADAALAWLVWRGLEGHASEHRRLFAAGLVALGPVFVTISGYAAQIDAVSILPAVVALLVWERAGSGRGAVAGLLIGLAASTKTVPLLMLLALAPSARSWREALTLGACAVAVLLLTLVPFLMADSSGVLGLRHYAGAPGMGGLSLVLQPNLANMWLTHPVTLSRLTEWLFIKHSWVANGLAVVGFAAFALRFRPQPRQAAALLWLLVLAFGSGFFFQYLIWVLPFLLLAGYVRAVALLQAAITVPMLVFYVTAWRSEAIVYVYVVLMLAVWAGWVLGSASIGRRLATA